MPSEIPGTKTGQLGGENHLGAVTSCIRMGESLWKVFYDFCGIPWILTR